MMRIDPKRLNDGGEVLSARSIEKALRERELSRRSQALLAAAGEAAPDRHWHVLLVGPACDNSVDNALTNAGVEHWMAARSIRRRRRGGRRHQAWSPIVAPALPGYLFVRVAWTPAAAAGLRGIDGVEAVIGGWECPSPLKDNELDKLRVRVEKDPEFLAVLLGALKEGDRVRLDDGPCAGFQGIVTMLGAARRVRVEVDMFGRKVPLTVDVDGLTKAD